MNALIKILRKPKSNFIFNAWNGSSKLWLVFWVYNVIFGVTIEVVYEYISTLNYPSTNIIFAPLLAIYFIWISVSLWKCAYNAKSKVWGHLVRILLAISVVAAGQILVLEALGYDTYF